MRSTPARRRGDRRRFPISAMPLPFRQRCPLPFLLAPLLGIAGCGGDVDETPKVLARPVTVFSLEQREPGAENLIPGVVVPYRQTEIAFEVGGRVTTVLDVGEEVVGARVGRTGETLVDENGSAVQLGDIIAEIDKERYERAVTQAELRLEAARLDVKAQEVNLETVTKAQLDSARSGIKVAEANVRSANEEVAAAKANAEFAQTTHDRNLGLLPSGAVSDIAVKQSQTELEAANTRYEQALNSVTTRELELANAESAVAEVEGSRILLEAQIQALRAQVDGRLEELSDAKRNLADCVLRAPYPGRITTVHVGEGSYIQPGSPIVTLTMMNPIQVEVTTSATEDDRLVVGSDAKIYPTIGTQVDLTRGVQATLYEKEGIADESTRTFRIGFIGPNQRRVSDEKFPDLPRVRYVLPILDNPLQLPGRGLYALSEGIYEDDSGTYLFKVLGLTQGARSTESLTQRLEAKKIPVTLGDNATRIASFTLVEILESEGIQAGDLVVSYPAPEHLDGFLIDERRWLFRPGNMVRVSIDQGNLERGYYVPIQSIRERDGATWVFALEEGDRVRAIDVTLGASFRELRQIESEELGDGLRIVNKGAHFLADGDTVTVLSQ